MKKKVQHNIHLQPHALLLLITCFTCLSLHAEKTNPKLPVVQAPVFKKGSINIINYDAVADSRILITIKSILLTNTDLSKAIRKHTLITAQQQLY